MWVFKSKHREAFLAANPKVLTQTLLVQESLVRYTSRWRYFHFMVKELHPGWGPFYVMLVRNPFKRVESFFKEKLRQKVKLVLEEKNPYTLKRHQTIFYPYLKISESHSLQAKVNGLLALDFKRYVKIIPEVYKIEDHLSPQTFNFSRQFIGSFRTMKMNRFVHLESREEMKWMEEYFKLDLSIRVNDSSDVTDKIEWDDECVSIVQKIYKQDFDTFGYDIRYP